jgi:predicted DsbA family dithiol-disulfide isomerase
MNHVPDRAVCGVSGCSTSFRTVVHPSPIEIRSVQQLAIVSDVICPWCYVAKQNLGMALALSGSNLQATWLPYELNPGMPKEGMNRREYRSRKFGSWTYSQQLDRQVAAAGERAGILFRHDLIERTPDTFEAHRLIWLAGRENKQDPVVEALFRAYFNEDRAVGNQQVLSEIAKQVGLSEATLAAFRNGRAGAEDVRREAAAAQQRGICGVPTFLLDGEPLFSGALPPEEMARRLKESLMSHA